MLAVNSILLAVKFLGVKSYLWIFKCSGQRVVSTLNPLNCSRANCNITIDLYQCEEWPIG